MLVKELLYNTDNKIIGVLNTLYPITARIAIFIVFFWFGALKVFDLSPANPLVADLLQKTLPFITFDEFIVMFGIYEMIIGLAFLIPKFERFAIIILFPHMIMTALPLFLLGEMAWQKAFVPTLEGQYIIKNLAIIALAFGIGARLKPLKNS